MKNSNNLNKVALAVSMIVFGTVGIFSKKIPLPSGIIALARASIGAVMLALFMILRKKKPCITAIYKNAIPIVISGFALGINWILFFLACKTTTVPTATLSYYLAPAILVILGVLIFNDKITLKAVLTVPLSIIGIAFAGGVVGGGIEGVSAYGIMCGVVAAVFYAIVVICNKFIKDIDSVDKTLCQFIVSIVILLPYVLIAERDGLKNFSKDMMLPLLIIGILHTGIAYVLYFGAASKLPTLNVALLSFIDPIVSVFVSVLFFEEKIGVYGIVGAILIIGSSVASEINFGELKARRNTINVNNSEEK